ncbi:NADP-dependent 3-hydroxy acid dehydrogenase YdfG [Rhizobium sp. NFR07]|uniref:SDR family NAD(P)-dependent oxidoreductase n=1 Tax=Rhizobium sp. NFR07 TaxID=1566262 RepID=UPI0008EC2754|nr:SDR family NAD(P)-dependent oxidoreductase [Rhizobium sp. NFR07]SFB56990.1 NADP-dependent 3-hydroxy acid dehydrogenase YdfG [Rhizobium sp. NFR07]
MIDLQRSALVVGVGAVAGLGAAYGRRFAMAGYRVLLAGRSPDKVETAAEDIRSRGGQARSIIGDASIEADAIKFASAAEDWAPLEVAVHNAGTNRRDSFLELEVANLEQLWREHTLGAFLTGREAARRMVPRGQGTILFTGATGSLRGKALFAAFAAAKAGERALSQSLAREVGPKGIHVAHLIIDGGINGDRLLRSMPNLRGERGEDGLLLPDDIADTAFLVHQQKRSAWTQETDLRPWSEVY